MQPQHLKNEDVVLLFTHVICAGCTWTASCVALKSEHCACFCVCFGPPQRRKENNNIFVDDLKKEGEKRPIPKPCRTFLEAFQHYPEIMDNIKDAGFVNPTPIQVWTCHPLSLILW